MINSLISMCVGHICQVVNLLQKLRILHKFYEVFVKTVLRNFQVLQQYGPCTSIAIQYGSTLKAKYNSSC